MGFLAEPGKPKVGQGVADIIFCKIVHVVNIYPRGHGSIVACWISPLPINISVFHGI